MLRGFRLVPALRYSIRQYAPQKTSQFSEEDFRLARQWLATFSGIPAGIYDISYSRASGPGGQNVNKVNSKATLKVDLDALLSRIPLVLHEGIRRSPYRADRSDALVISSDESRKQSDNRDKCEIKLRKLIQDVGRESVPGETSDDTKQRVRRLKAAENENRLRGKKLHSSKKSSRRKGSSDW